MSGEIIRQGDPTSHGGTVLEGSLMDICHGKPIAYVGHKTSCPKCKGTYPIIEGALTTSFYGMGVALAGMKTACGATLVATQFTDIVEYGTGGADANKRDNGAVAPAAAALAAAATLQGFAMEDAAASDELSPDFDLYFVVRDRETGELIRSTPYKITLSDGREFLGTTDESGHTQKIYADSPQVATIEVPYYDESKADAEGGSDACGC